jgi:hypothetical protein
MEQQQQRLGLHVAAAAHNLCAYRCAHTDMMPCTVELPCMLCASCNVAEFAFRGPFTLTVPVCVCMLQIVCV